MIIYNSLSTQVYSLDLQDTDKLKVDFSQYPSGVYFVHTIYMDDSFTVDKIVKK